MLAADTAELELELDHLSKTSSALIYRSEMCLLTVQHV